MRIATWNVNGLRAAIRKGFAEALERIEPDVLLLQEIRVQPDQLADEWVSPDGWHVVWNPAERKGYSGTAIWSRYPMKIIGRGLEDNDEEGRVVRVRIEGIEFASVYLPSGSSSDERQGIKEAWMADFMPWSRQFLRKRSPVIFGGDFNIAHSEKDIFYAKSNEKTSGFLPHEREWIGALFELGWRDFIREHFGDVQGPYSWWSNRGKARELDRGWRIDYLLGNATAAKRFKAASIDREGGLTVSDHAPVIIDLE